MSFAFGGDALFLYFNTTFHTCHGSGIMLESMNYPFGESIFMTDAQGALSIFISTLNDLGIDTCTYSMGIINGLIMYLLPLCAIFLFLILRRFKLNIYYAMIVSVAITIMAPQTFRIVSHYGLSYPFYIPMCIYWVLRKFDLQRWEWKDLLFIGTAAFFYLNNPYVGFAGLLFIPIICFIKALQTLKNKAFFFQFFGITSIIVVAGYAIIKLSDPFINRIVEQNGFFTYDITVQGSHGILNGFLTSKYGFTNAILSKLYYISPTGFENTVNLGIIPLFTLLAAFIFLIIKLFKGSRSKIAYPTNDFKYIILGAFLLGLIACNGIIPLFMQEYIKANFSSLLLFKATGRFIWLGYFTLAIWSAWWLHNKLQNLGSKKLVFSLLMLIGLLWITESFKGFYEFNEEMSKHGNMFKRSTNWKKYLAKNDINPEDYQAILALPIMQGWASKLTTALHWRSQYESTTMSLTTGLPLIDGMLSRMSLDHAMNIVQLGSHPLIDKQLADQFPNEKPILVMDMTGTDSLVTNQNYILSRSRPLTKYKFFDMYRLEIDSLRSSPVLDSVQKRFRDGDYDEPLYYNGFADINQNEFYRYENGSYIIEPGIDRMLHEIPMTGLRDSMEIEISFWTLFTPKHEHTPKFKIQSIGSNNKIIESISVDSQYSKDVHNNWVKITAILKSRMDIKNIRILSTSKKKELVDDILIRNLNTDVVVKRKEGNTLLWNNYLIHK